MVHAAAGRSRRDRHQDRAARQRRRHARVGPAVPQGRSRATTRAKPRTTSAAIAASSRSPSTSRRPTGSGSSATSRAQADVLVENFKVGGLAKYGLDYASLAPSNPRLVYCSITGFGQDGPYADRAGYDFIVQGMSGFMSVTGERDDVDGRRAAEGGRRHHRPDDRDVRDGRDPGRARASRPDRSGTVDRRLPARLGGRDDGDDVAQLSRHRQCRPGASATRTRTSCPYQIFACADGHLILAVGNDAQFAKFCAVAGQPEWAADSRFAKNADRVRNRDVLVPLIAAVVRTRTQKRLARRAGAAGRAVRPDQPDRPGVRRSAGRRARHADRPAASSWPGTVPQVRTPLGFSATPLGLRSAAAAPGRAHGGGAARTARPRRRRDHRARAA